MKIIETKEKIELLFNNVKPFITKKAIEMGLPLNMVDAICNNFKTFLIEKNRRYGNSALEPLQIFSKVSAGNPVCNRLDDKLSRVKNASDLKKNDVADVFGYAALLLIKNNWTTFDDLLD